MSSLLVSSRTYTAGGRIAAAAAHILHYDFADFDALAVAASSASGVPAEKLRNALLRPPSLLGMADLTRRHLATLLIAECAARILRDSVVLHVPYASFLVPGISHVLRARITSPSEQRAAVAAAELHVSPDKAARRIAADDRDADVLSCILFGKADDDASYDDVVEVAQMTPEGAAAALARGLQERRYLATSYSRRCASDLAAGADIRAALAVRGVEATVAVHDGRAAVRAQASPTQRAELAPAVQAVAARHSVIAKVDLVWVDDLFDTYAASMR